MGKPSCLLSVLQEYGVLRVTKIYVISLSIYLFACLSLYLLLLLPLGAEDIRETLRFTSVGRTPWTGDQPDARPLCTQDTTNAE
jgi:hypothetical protein